MFTSQEVQQANIEVHTKIADQYLNEPHHRPENKERIRANLIRLQEMTGGTSLLDVGCGMGFVIDIAKEMYSIIRGVDITPAMLERVNVNSDKCDIKVEIAQAESLPHTNNSFDVCTAHALLHHLHDIKPVFKEVFRVLKSGGVFYSDLDPNGYFWEALKFLDPQKNYHSSIEREINAVNQKDKEISETFNIKLETVQQAEYLQHIKGGFKEEEIVTVLAEVGFKKVQVRYEWFLGEGVIIHGEKTKHAADVFRLYLKDMLPLTRHLFKYISIWAQK